MSEKKNNNLSELLARGRKVSRKEKISLTFGQFGIGNLGSVLGLYLFIYYTQYFGLRLELYIIANVIFVGYNALNDFIFGYYADRTKHRLGRRIPYLRYCAIPFGLSFVLFWIPFPGSYPGDLYLGQEIKFLQLLIVLFMYDTFITIIGISFNSLPPEMTESTTERTNISVYITIGQFGSAISVIATPFLFNLGLEFFRVGTLIMGAVSAISFIIVSYTIKERVELHELHEFSKVSFKNDFVQTFKNKSFMSVVIFNFCVASSWTLINNYSRIYGYLFGIDNGELLISGINYFSFFFSIPIIRHFSKKVEIKRIIITTSLIGLVGIFSLFFIDLIFGIVEVYFIIIMLNGFIAGVGLLGQPFMSDVIDVDELNTGRRRESMHMAINALFTVPAGQIIAIVVSLILLSFNYNQVGTAIEQPIEALFGIKIILSTVPMAIVLLILLSQMINPLEGEYYKEMKRKVLKLHQEKEGEKR